VCYGCLRKYPDFFLIRSYGCRTSTLHSNNPPSSPKQITMDIVLSDPVIFRFLEEDASTKVVSRKTYLKGFECYIVEQWACSRTDPTFIINTYSGDPSHRILVNVLNIPADESEWGPRLSLYFRSLSRYNTKSRATPLGSIMVTNLSTFPSSLTVILIPDGDVYAHREGFFLNEDLKRLRCSGRVALTLSVPSDATAAKFFQLYRVSKKVPLNEAVIELVKLCQIALMLFGKLEPEYIDGLLCDMTEKAITDWWVEFGADYYSIEPHDGILGPTTVAALLGMLMGARNRLNAYGAPIGHDVFDIENTKRGIAYFQKSHNLRKNRRLDRPTLTKLHKSTAKAASGDGWFVPRAVKSTMAELSGKRGDLVMEMMGHRDKSGIAEIETADLEKFVRQVRGSTAKWLWRGKTRPQKSLSLDQNYNDPNIAIPGEESASQIHKIVSTSSGDGVPNVKFESPSSASSSSSRESAPLVESGTNSPSKRSSTLACRDQELPSEIGSRDLEDSAPSWSSRKTVGFHRTQSLSDFEQTKEKRNLAYWPRRLSFSLAEEGLSTRGSILREFYGGESGALTSPGDLEQSRRLRRGLYDLETDKTQWVQSGINDMQVIDSQLSKDQEYLQDLLSARLDVYQEFLHGAKELTEHEREELLELAKGMEDAKAFLDYELNVVEGKYEDMQAEVANFERQVISVEKMIGDLEKGMQPEESWRDWMARVGRRVWGKR
jgi:hypothetical protein